MSYAAVTLHFCCPLLSLQRGRSASNSAFRDIFATLCPGQVFNVRLPCCPSMLLAVPVRCMLCLHAVVAQSAGLHPALHLCLFTLLLAMARALNRSLLQLKTTPSILVRHSTCRAGPACCRTCRTACSSWLASPWARRPHLTSLGVPRAPLALNGVRRWMPMLGRPPRQQRQQQRRQRRHQQQAAPAYRPGRRLGWLQSWGQHHLRRQPARLWGRLLRRQLGLQPQLRAPLWHRGP